MKIALVHNLPSGGAKRHTMEQLRELNRRSHEIVEFRPASADAQFAPFDPYVRRQHVFVDRPVRLLRRRIPLVTPYIHAAQMAAALRALERRDARMAKRVDLEACDLALVKDCQVAMNPYVLRYLRTPAVFQCHHGHRDRVEREGESGRGTVRERMKASYYAPATALVERKLARDQAANIAAARTILVNSQFSQRLLRSSYGVESEVVYPGINLEVFGPTGGSASSYVLTVGSLIFSKGHRFLIEALATIPERRRPALIIAANSRDTGEERFILGLARQNGVDLQITTVFDDRRLTELYSCASVFVYAPRQEALGMALLEAAACGTPAVAVAEGGVCETVCDGETGWLVPRDPTVFGRRLDSLIGDNDTRARMSRAGLEWIRTRWTWSAAVDRLESLLEQARSA